MVEETPWAPCQKYSLGRAIVRNKSVCCELGSPIANIFIGIIICEIKYFMLTIAGEIVGVGLINLGEDKFGNFAEVWLHLDVKV